MLSISSSGKANDFPDDKMNNSNPKRWSSGSEITLQMEELQIALIVC